MIPALLAVHAADLALTLAVTAAHAADLYLTLLCVSAYGLSVEQNGLMAAALSLGPLGGLAAKAALLSLICAAAAIGPRYRRFLLGGALVSGLVGAASGAWGLVA